MMTQNLWLGVNEEKQMRDPEKKHHHHLRLLESMWDPLVSHYRYRRYLHHWNWMPYYRNRTGHNWRRYRTKRSYLHPRRT